MYRVIRNNETMYNYIVDLYRGCFGINISIHEVSNKYNTQSFGVSNVGYLAFHESGEVAAYYGVFPLEANIVGSIKSCAQSGDTMTSPKHQKKGLFVKLAEESYSLCSKLGIELVFGFPNENSFPGFKKKLNWRFTGNMQKFSISTYNFPFCELAFKFKFISPLYKIFTKYKIEKLVVDHSKEVINFHNTTDNSYIQKNDNFFKYKMNNSSCKLISYDGFTFFIKAEGHLMVGDVEYFDGFDINKCLAALKRLSRKLLCFKIVFYFSKNHWMYLQLISIIEPHDSLPIGFRIISKEFAIEKFQFSLGDFDTF